MTDKPKINVWVAALLILIALGIAVFAIRQVSKGRAPAPEELAPQVEQMTPIPQTPREPPAP